MSRTEAKLKTIAAAEPSIRRNASRVARPKTAALPEYYKLSEITKGLEAVFDVAAHINSSLDHNTIIQSGLDHLKRIVDADSWTIYLTENEHRRAELNRLDNGQAISAEIDAFPPESLLGQTFRQGISICIKNAAMLKAAEPRYNKKTIAGVLCLPLMAAGQPIGAIEAILTRQQVRSVKQPRIRLAQKVTELVAGALHNATLYADVEHLCLIDDLTRLYNIRFLRQSLETEIRRAKRYRSSVALIFLDLDGFKNVNDLHGHLIGSATLIETARIIYTMVRDTDFVARYGGDEFVIILPETTAERAAQIAERIRQGIENYWFGSEASRQFKLTASFGVAAYPEHGATSQELIRRADAAMYMAKDASKNAVALAF